MTSIDPSPGVEGTPRPRRNILDLASEGMMAISSLALFSMAVIVSLEVAARYFFHSPTTWAWDVNVQLMMLMVMFGLAEVYRRDDYVRVDVLTSLLSPRNRLILNIILAPLLLFIIVIIIWASWHYFQQSWMRGQHAPTSFAPPLWPIKATIPIGFTLLLAHGVLKLIRDIGLLRNTTRAKRA